MMKDEATSNDNKEMSEGISRSVPEVPSIFMNPGQSHKESRKETKPESQVTEDFPPGITLHPYHLPDFLLISRENKSQPQQTGYGSIRSILSWSATINGLQFTDSKRRLSTGNWQCTVQLGDVPLVTSVHQNEKDSLTLAYTTLLDTLKTTQFSILLKDMRQDGEEIKVGEEPKQEDKLSSDNVGFKLMKMMGWSGGGLGSNEQGRVNPVEQQSKVGRAGLGLDLTEKNFNDHVHRFLTDYLRSDSNRDLVFCAVYTPKERNQIHTVARRLGLQSKSHNIVNEAGEKSRQLIVRRPVEKSAVLVKEVRQAIRNQDVLKPGRFGSNIQILPPSASTY